MSFSNSLVRRWDIAAKITPNCMVKLLNMLKKSFSPTSMSFLLLHQRQDVEASIRNCVDFNENVLATCCGAFSDKWADVVKKCGRNCDELKVEWGTGRYR